MVLQLQMIPILIIIQEIIQNNTSIQEDLNDNSGISISYKDGYNNWSTTITYDWEGDL